jgi:hypothetical protein
VKEKDKIDVERIILTSSGIFGNKRTFSMGVQ